MRVSDDAGHSAVTAGYFNCVLEMNNPIKIRIWCELLTKALDNEKNMVKGQSGYINLSKGTTTSAFWQDFL